MVTGKVNGDPLRVVAIVVPAGWQINENIDHNGISEHSHHHFGQSLAILSLTNSRADLPPMPALSVLYPVLDSSPAEATLSMLLVNA